MTGGQDAAREYIATSGGRDRAFGWFHVIAKYGVIDPKDVELILVLDCCDYDTALQEAVAKVPKRHHGRILTEMTIRPWVH